MTRSLTIAPVPHAGGRRRVLLVATEDWFVASHFKPLIRALVGSGHALAVAARYDRHESTISALGGEPVPIDLRRGGFNPVAEIGGFVRLLRLLRSHRPDIIHAIALKPVFLAALAFSLTPARALVLHPTGTGIVGTDQDLMTRLAGMAVMALIRLLSRRPNVWILVENPDDMAAFAAPSARQAGRAIQLGGAGVDPDFFTALPMPETKPVTAAFIGRMVWSKGVDTLVHVHQMVIQRGLNVALALHGDPDDGNPRAIPLTELTRWSSLPGIRWHGRTNDPRQVWREAAIAVIPSRGGEGLPRVLLEAAASARPLIVTDVPGCRDFVRDGIEGIVVPPGDEAALAAALTRLVQDPDLRRRMGEAARARLLAGYTEAHVEAAIAETYRKITSAL